MKGLVLVGDYFEDTELIATIDVWLRHNEQITLASVMKRREVVSKCGLKITLDKLLEEVDLSEFDFLFIPGGPGSFKILAYMKEVDEVISYFVKANKLVSAICAAPMLIGKLGYLKGRNYTVYPGFENQIIGGNYLNNLGVVRDGNIVTGKSMYYSIDFALKVIEALYSKDASNNLLRSLKAE